MKKYLTYEEAKPVVHRIARKYKLKTKEDYENWWLVNKEIAEVIGLPQFPEEVYSVMKNKYTMK